MSSCLFFQAEDGIRDLVRSRGLGDVYKRQVLQERPEAHSGVAEGRLAAVMARYLVTGGAGFILSLIHI